MAVARPTDNAVGRGSGGHDVGTVVVDNHVHRDREPAVADTRRLPDGRGRPSHVPDGVRAARAGRLGAGAVPAAERVVPVRGPRAARLRHGHRVHRGARLPGRDGRRGHPRLARLVSPGHELVRYPVRVRLWLVDVVLHAGRHHVRGADTVDRAVDVRPGIAVLSGHEGQHREGAEVAVVVAAVRRQDRTVGRTAEHDARARGAFVAVCQQPAENVRPSVGHRADHGHRADIRGHQRARSVRVFRVREPRAGRAGDDHAQRVRGHAGPGGAVQRHAVRRGHRTVRPAIAAAGVVRRLLRQPGGRRVRPVPRRARAAGAGRAGRRHVLRERRRHADGHHNRVRVLSHAQPGAGQRHPAAGDDHRVAGVAKMLPARRRSVRRVRQLRAVRRRVDVQRGVRLPVHTGDQRADVQRDRGSVRAGQKTTAVRGHQQRASGRRRRSTVKSRGAAAGRPARRFRARRFYAGRVAKPPHKQKKKIKQKKR